MLHLEKKKKGRLEMQFGNQNVLQLIENVTIFGDTCYLADRNWYLNTKRHSLSQESSKYVFAFDLAQYFFMLFVDRRSDLTWHWPKDLGHSVAFSSLHKVIVIELPNNQT